jgi:hypothetical protein
MPCLDAGNLLFDWQFWKWKLNQLRHTSKVKGGKDEKQRDDKKINIKRE